MNILMGIGIFAAVLLVIEGSYYFARQWRLSKRRAFKQRLAAILMETEGSEIGGIERQRLYSRVPWLNRWLGRVAWFRRMNLFLEQSGARHPLGVYLLLTLLLVMIGYLAGSFLFRLPLIALVGAILLGSLPFLFIYRKRTRRMEKFERQLPEAMDLIARALKAGHSFSSALKMVGTEMEDPIGPEFERTLNEINLGVDVAEALKNLSQRMECRDLRFFVVSVILQRETGGNLAEILEKIADLIRERFKLQGRIRVLSAEGRLSAIILIFLPFLIALAIYFLNPAYLQPLATDPIGHIMISFALIFLILGIIAMKKMVKIEV